jgi:hypothetical protein
LLYSFKEVFSATFIIHSHLWHQIDRSKEESRCRRSYSKVKKRGMNSTNNNSSASNKNNDDNMDDDEESPVLAASLVVEGT